MEGVGVVQQRKLDLEARLASPRETSLCLKTLPISYPLTDPVYAFRELKPAFSSTQPSLGLIQSLMDMHFGSTPSFPNVPSYVKHFTGQGAYVSWL
ncbi:rCG37187 [Rattus norvegicus]|uniref:RCG37187 n=1 Tax=Rattus norvegicus TaxID=10116 RepID=A6HUB3_RAT|nr:rCG37187 [Rattus norvegicus]